MEVLGSGRWLDFKSIINTRALCTVKNNPTEQSEVAEANKRVNLREKSLRRERMEPGVQRKELLVTQRGSVSTQKEERAEDDEYN